MSDRTYWEITNIQEFAQDEGTEITLKNHSGEFNLVYITAEQVETLKKVLRNNYIRHSK